MDRFDSYTVYVVSDDYGAKWDETGNRLFPDAVVNADNCGKAGRGIFTILSSMASNTGQKEADGFVRLNTLQGFR